MEVKSIKQIFDILTDTLGLPVNCLLEYFMLGIIGEIAFRIARTYIGKLYRRKIIHGKAAGKVAHWGLRFLIYVSLWAIAQAVIFIVKWVRAYPLIAIIIFVTIIIVTVVAVIIYRYKIKPAKIHNN